ncbi:MAG: anhydro-N-acetylmuramic acid kinase [Planctomycetota bacterium]
MTQPTRERIVVGCMTGTSLDGLDVALVRIVGTGLEMSAEYLGHVSRDLPDILRETLMHLASGGAAEPVVYMRAARELGELHADSVRHLLEETKGPKPEFVVAHGQTIWHDPRPRKGDAEAPNLGPMSWQLFDPWPVVKRIGVPVCYDLRQADLVAGGEGAPLTPLADWVMYREKADLIVNLGGVMNFTWWPLDSSMPSYIEGGDTCLCNLLLDGFAQQLLGEPYDRDGQAAARGKLVESILYDFQDRFEVLGAGERSLGREDLEDGAIKSLIAAHPGVTPPDLLFNAIACIGQSVGEVFEGMAAQRLVLAGGGVRNKTLVRYIRDVIEGDSFCEGAVLSDDLGIPCEAREAMGFAVLGALSQDGVPVSLPQVTGAKDPGVAGVWAGV